MACLHTVNKGTLLADNEHFMKNDADHGDL